MSFHESSTHVEQQKLAYPIQDFSRPFKGILDLICYEYKGHLMVTMEYNLNTVEFLFWAYIECFGYQTLVGLGLRFVQFGGEGRGIYGDYLLL